MVVSGLRGGGVEMLTHIIILSGYTSKFSVILQFFLITAQDFLVILQLFFTSMTVNFDLRY